MIFLFAKLLPRVAGYGRLLSTFAVSAHGKLNISMPCRLARIVPIMSDSQMVIRLIDSDTHQVEELLQVNIENNNGNQLSDVKVSCRSDIVQALKDNLQFEIQLPMQYGIVLLTMKAKY